MQLFILNKDENESVIICLTTNSHNSLHTRGKNWNTPCPCWFSCACLSTRILETEGREDREAGNKLEGLRRGEIQSLCGWLLSDTVKSFCAVRYFRVDYPDRYTKSRVWSFVRRTDRTKVENKEGSRRLRQCENCVYTCIYKYTVCFREIICPHGYLQV
jgi:hypothetical protein